MKKVVALALLVAMITLGANSAFSSPAYTTETLIDDWSNRFIDPTYWSSKWVSESTSSQAVTPSEEHTPQHDALHSAIEAIIELEFETLESLSQYYEVKFAFYYIADFDLYAWDVDLYREQRPAYTIRIDATSGRLFAIYVNDTSYIFDCRVEQSLSSTALIDYWDKLYSDSPNYSPEVYASEMQDWPLPSNEDMTQRAALHYAIAMILALSKHNIDVLYGYHPYVSFDVSPVANRWFITIFQDSNDSGLCETFSFAINAMTGKLENFIWNHM